MIIENIQGGVLMLNLKEQTIKELEKLKPQALAKVYDLKRGYPLQSP